MKFIIDTDNKTIELLETVKIDEFTGVMKDFLKAGTGEWNVLIPQQPFPVFPQYPTPHMPWEITCTAGTVAKAAENPESSSQHTESQS